MTTELTLCPDCGKPSNNGRTCRLCDSEDALHKALTQRPAAQEVHPLASRCYAMSEPHLSGYRLVLGFETLEAVDAAHTWVANVRKATQQATPNLFARNGAVKALADLAVQFKSGICTEESLESQIRGILETSDAMIEVSAPQQATPERCKSCDDTGHVHDQIGEWRGVCNCPAGDAIRSKATPEPVREAIIGRWLYEKWWAEYGKLADVDKPYYTFDELPEKQRAAYDSLALMLTHPAPGVPESPRQLRKRFEQHMRDVFACKDTAFLSIDGGKTYLDGSMDNHWRTWLAAQAKGGE